jgi:hypothetical protein
MLELGWLRKRILKLLKFQPYRNHTTLK